jgi:hypothetical protein
MIDAKLNDKRMKALTWLYAQIAYFERRIDSCKETIKSIEEEMRKENTNVSV